MLKFAFILALLCCCRATLLNEIPSQAVNETKILEDVNKVIASFKSSAATVNFIIALNKETRRENIDLINNVIARLSDVVYFAEDLEFINPRHRLYNVIFLDNFSSFQRLYPKMTSANFKIGGYFLMVFVEGSIPELSEVTRLLWRIFIHKINFLVDGELLTFRPFHGGKCDDSMPVAVKNFSSITSKEEIFPDKTSNMFKCPVKVVTFNCAPMMMIEYGTDKLNFDFKGIDGEMLKLLAGMLNFKIDLFHISDLIRKV